VIRKTEYPSEPTALSSATNEGRISMKKSFGLGMLEAVRESLGPDGQGDDLYGLPVPTDGVHRNSCVAERVGFQLAVMNGQVSTGGDPRSASAAAAIHNIVNHIPAHKSVEAKRLTKGVRIRCGLHREEMAARRARLSEIQIVSSAESVAA
jgi:hypothetical protein